MLERELKLHVPAAHQAAVSQAMALMQKQASFTLAARYFDTPQRDLARQQAALRLRLEGEEWVQTLKLRAQDELSVIEFNHLRPAPSLDLSLYNGTVAEELIQSLSQPLSLRYQTQVVRTTAVVQYAQSEIEIAWDVGQIKANQHTLPISEVEFELKTGTVDAVFDLGAQWLKHLPLIIELRSKSERGDGLYELSTQRSEPLHGATAALALADQPFRLGQAQPTEITKLSPLYHQAAQRFLTQIIRNAAFLGGIDEIQAPNDLQAQYLTLMRVGMRRLRSCRQLFKPWLTPLEKAHTEQLLEHYKKFGRWRDNDMLWLELQPKLVAAGLPAAKKLEPPKGARRNPRLLAANQAYQLLLLENLRNLVLGQGLINKADAPEQTQRLVYRLNRTWIRIQALIDSFEELTPQQRHYLRNQIKRLRYNLEALGYEEASPLYLYLAKAQDQLGHLCDAYVAKNWYQTQAVNSTQKQFALDWLKKKIEKYDLKSKKTLSLLQSQRLNLKVLELVSQ